jgi:large subunit ribosomal protein L10
VVKGGVLDGKALTADDIRKLAELEPREVLLAKLAGAMKASLSQAVYLLNAPLAQAARVFGALQSKAEQDPSVLGGGAGTPAPVAAAPSEEAAAPAEAADAASTETPDAETVAETAAAPVAEESAEPTAEATEEAAEAAPESESPAEAPAAASAEDDSTTEA